MLKSCIGFTQHDTAFNRLMICIDLGKSMQNHIQIPYFSIDNERVIYTKMSKFVKNEHARYTLGMKKGKNLERLITATSQARF